MRNKLISGVAGAAFILAASGSAFAADLARKMPVKAPPPPPPVPIFSWTGFYIGGNAGYGWGRTTDDVSYLPSPSDFGNIPFSAAANMSGWSPVITTGREYYGDSSEIAIF